MNLKLSLAAASLAAGLLIATMPGMAAGTASISALKDVAAGQPSGIEKTLWGSEKCHWGLGGYHKYVPGVGRIQCTARKCWKNSLGFRRCKWF